MTCVHWGKGSDTHFIDGFLVTDFVCRKCGEEYQVRAKYLPWNTAVGSAASHEARHAIRSSKRYAMGD